MGHCAVPGGTKLYSSVGGPTESQEKLTKYGIHSKVCGMKYEPLRTATSNLKTVFVTFANTYFSPSVEKFDQSWMPTQSHGGKALVFCQPLRSKGSLSSL